MKDLLRQYVPVGVEVPVGPDGRMRGYGVVSFASEWEAERARRLLGWKPYRPSIEEEAESILKDEKARLG